MSDPAKGSTSPTEGKPNAGNNNPKGQNNNRRNKNRQSRHANRSSRFEGKCETIKRSVYDVTIAGNSTDLFTTTTKDIAEYIATEYDDAGEYRTGLVELALPEIPRPDDVLATDALNFEIWKLDMRDFRDKTKKREKNNAKAFALILGQCSRAIRDRIEASNTWLQVDEASDVIALLKLIRQSIFTGATSRYRQHSLITAEEALYRFQQKERMSNSEYLEKLKGLVEVVEHFGGAPGQSKAQVSYYTDSMDEAKAEATARETYLATLLIIKSDPKRYGNLIADVENSFTRGNDGYPRTLAAAYDMLVNYKAPHTPKFHAQEAGVAFYTAEAGGQGGRGRGERGRGGGRGAGRGAGRGRGYGSNGQYAQQREAANEDTEADDVHGQNHMIDNYDDNYNDEVTPYDHAYSNAIANKSLPGNWILLDSCSSVDLISNKKLLKDIHDSNRIMNVHCNAGTVVLTQQGTVGSYPRPVWYNKGGIANIMSLFNVSQHYRITMDTKQENCFNLHRTNGTLMKFEPCSKGLYRYILHANETAENVWNTLITVDQWNMISTVKDKADRYTNRAYKRAVQARKMQKIIMNPSARELMDTNIQHLKDCTVSRQDVITAEDILGPNLGALKGKTVNRPSIHVKPGSDPVPHHIMEIHKHIILAIDIMFVNKIPFLITTSRNLHFGTIEALPDRRITTIKNKLQTVTKIYKHRGFRINSILADPEFEHIRPAFPMLNCCAADEHVPEVERYIRTVKDRVRSTFTVLPFRRIPRVMIIHLVKNAVFWLNSFPHRDGVSSQHSPRYIMTGKELTYKQHVRMEFGAYAQTHEDHDNSMTDRTIGAICLGPSGNQQGGHHFMNLTTGLKITRDHWTELPMPSEVINRVNQFGRQQNMPTTITFADRQGREIQNTLDEMIDEFSQADDASYATPSEQDDESTLEYDTDDEHDNNDDHSSEDSDADEDDEDYSPGDDDSFHSADSDDESLDAMDDDEVSQVSEHPDTDMDNTGMDAPDLPTPEPPAPTEADTPTNTIENTGVGNPTEITGVSGDPGGIHDPETPGPNETREPDYNDNTLEDEFKDATATGELSALDPNSTRPQRSRKPNRDNIYDYTNLTLGVLEDMPPATLFTILMDDDPNDMLNFLTAQMSAKKGLKVFGDLGAEAIKKELEQLVYRKVMEGRKANTLTPEDKKAALKYLMFLKQKRCGKIKGRGCADGRKQRVYKTKDETSAPTMSIESLFLTCVIDAMENRHVLTCDIPGAFMQADMDEMVHIKLEAELADLLTKVDPTYREYTTYERGKKVIYAELNKALYGTVQAAYLFWKKLSKFLIEDLGFEVNPYDWCVVNKIIDGKQCTIGWYVDDLKISHASAKVNEDIFDKLQNKFGREAPLTVNRGTTHEYLGMTIDFSNKGKVEFSMQSYIDELVSESPDEIMSGISSTPAAGHLFEVNDNEEKLDRERAIDYHHLVAKLLYLCKRARPDLQLAVSFLTTRVQAPDVDDYKKLGRCLRYLRETRDLTLSLECSSGGAINWWVDASFGVHPDCRSHTGATMSLGAGSIYSSSTKQKINARSSTEAELIGLNDALTMILWTRHFLVGQGFTVKDNVVLQDNQSTMLLANNGRRSSGKKTRHIEIRYFFITDNIRRKKARVAYCPTGDMLADFFTKPLQGVTFRKFRSKILNLKNNTDVRNLTDGQECVGTNDITEARQDGASNKDIIKDNPKNNSRDDPEDKSPARLTYSEVAQRSLMPTYRRSVAQGSKLMQLAQRSKLGLMKRCMI